MINYIECIYSLFTVVYTFVNDIESTFKRVYIHCLHLNVHIIMYSVNMHSFRSRYL